MCCFYDLVVSHVGKKANVKKSQKDEKLRSCLVGETTKVVELHFSVVGI